MSESARKNRINRRVFLRRAALTITGSAATAMTYAWRVEPHWIEVVRRNLPIAHLPTSLVGKTLIQISDMHIGPVVDETYITQAMQRVSALRGDIVAVTGDYMTCHGAEQIGNVMRVLEHLRPGKLATIGILGNHDYGMQWANLDVANQLTARLRDAGITLLRNDRCEVEGLQIAGIDDVWGMNFRPHDVMSTLDARQASLVLCHNPDAMDLPVWAGYRGWILSGHTHGGQCKPPFFDAPVIPIKNHRYIQGAVDLFDGRMLYVNRGLGYLRRVRFNARPEITMFELTKAIT